jgi:hypothetical protein
VKIFKLLFRAGHGLRLFLLGFFDFFAAAVVSFAHKIRSSKNGRRLGFLSGGLLRQDFFLFLRVDAGRLGVFLRFLFLVRFRGSVAHGVSFCAG